MLFNSAPFLFGFFPIVFGVYYLLSHLKQIYLAKIWLGVASFIFYGWWNYAFVLLLAISIAFNYSTSVILYRLSSQQALQRTVLAFGIATNLLVLCYFKYFFVALAFLHDTGWISSDFGRVALPLGISFFTFTQIGYLVDCQQGIAKRGSLTDYVLFVTFFPHLIAGPILHHREIMPQFSDRKTYGFDLGMIVPGLALFMMGLFKKVVLADSIGAWADLGFSHAGEIKTLTAWSATIAYTFQLYFDFSGYSDMAVGLAAMFGIRFPINFNSPFKAKNTIEFWQRYHMTLTRYLTLLVYTPVSMGIMRRRAEKGLPTNKKALATAGGFTSLVVVPIFFTMFLSGVWHGAGLQFVIYGLLHACYLIVCHAWRVFGPAPKTHSRGIQRYFSAAWPVALNFLAVAFSLIFFRADNISQAWAMVGGMLGQHGQELPLLAYKLSRLHGLGFLSWLGSSATQNTVEIYTAPLTSLVRNICIMAGLGVIVWAFPNTNEILARYSPALQKHAPVVSRWFHWQPRLIWAVALAVAFAMAFSRLDHPSRFLYFQF